MLRYYWTALADWKNIASVTDNVTANLRRRQAGFYTSVKCSFGDTDTLVNFVIELLLPGERQ